MAKTAKNPSVRRIFKCTAQGDVVYIHATSLEMAAERLLEVLGYIPPQLLTFKEVERLPKGEVFL